MVMNTGDIHMRTLVLMVKTDFRQCFRGRLIAPLAALVPVGILVAVMRGDLSAATVVVLVAFGVLDHQFNASLSRSRTEWDALLLLPVSWKTIILAKNIASLAAWIALAGVISTVILYFTPRFPSPDEIAHALLTAWTLLFPLLIVGNLRSIQEPRKEEISPAREVLLAAGMFLFAVLCTIPYVLLTTLGESEGLSIAYGAAAAIVWWRWSVPHTAFLAQSRPEHP
jgi:hypothetical protein